GGACGLFCLIHSELLARGAAAFGRVVRSTRWQSVCLLVAGPVLAAAWAFRLQKPDDLAPPREPEAAEEPKAVRQFREVPDTAVCTDLGRPVKVFRLVYRNADPAKLERLQAGLLRRLGLEANVIALPEGDVLCDCSGWVFTGGRYWLGIRVNEILDDNGYRLVREPRGGGLVIYPNKSRDPPPHP